MVVGTTHSLPIQASNCSFEHLQIQLVKARPFAISLRAYAKNRYGPHHVQPLLFESLQMDEPKRANKCDNTHREQVEE